MHNVTIRRETDADISAISQVTNAAFAEVEYSSGTEAEIVEKLRDSDNLAVSLVAVAGPDIVGHVAMSPVRIEDGTGGWFGLGPVSVHPTHQNQGIGSALVEAALQALREGLAGGVVVLGEPRFYQRFGFAKAERLTYPGAPAQYFTALRLCDSRYPAGDVTYHPAFS
ncbi:GNAT family N-acetyltransferase [Corynebacterium tapiri]|uniref:N-acetyltransferase n=1 Tax=Corynebacterium tapiri TaxID=1448266 RepID=A0A5C4U2L7_9CORY|nr:N-acetyltransferase [Corynebacterium tapiri]TNL96795.1 N-acetyltransferase [Corynebacterium tapiri]